MGIHSTKSIKNTKHLQFTVFCARHYREQCKDEQDNTDHVPQGVQSRENDNFREKDIVQLNPYCLLRFQIEAEQRFSELKHILNSTLLPCF